MRLQTDGFRVLSADEVAAVAGGLKAVTEPAGTDLTTDPKKPNSGSGWTVTGNVGLDSFSITATNTTDQSSWSGTYSIPYSGGPGSIDLNVRDSTASAGFHFDLGTGDYGYSMTQNLSDGLSVGVSYEHVGTNDTVTVSLDLHW